MEKWESRTRVYDPLKVGSIDGTDDVPHDNGIRRAMEAIYRPNSRVVGNAKNSIFVARLHPNTTEETVYNAFAVYGSIKRHRLIRDIVTGFSKCYAFVEYEDSASADKAQRDANRSHLDGAQIFVDFECERTLRNWVPRRLGWAAAHCMPGGGFGGKKESGQLRFGGRDRQFKMPIKIPENRNSSRESYHKDSYRPYTKPSHYKRTY